MHLAIPFTHIFYHVDVLTTVQYHVLYLIIAYSIYHQGVICQPESWCRIHGSDAWSVVARRMSIDQQDSIGEYWIGLDVITPGNVLCPHGSGRRTRHAPHAGNRCITCKKRTHDFEHFPIVISVIESRIEFNSKYDKYFQFIDHYMLIDGACPQDSCFLNARYQLYPVSTKRNPPVNPATPSYCRSVVLWGAAGGIHVSPAGGTRSSMSTWHLRAGQHHTFWTPTRARAREERRWPHHHRRWHSQTSRVCSAAHDLVQSVSFHHAFCTCLVCCSSKAFPFTTHFALALGRCQTVPESCAL